MRLSLTWFKGNQTAENTNKLHSRWPPSRAGGQPAQLVHTVDMMTWSWSIIQVHYCYQYSVVDIIAPAPDNARESTDDQSSGNLT